jgi:hypothetical protein
MQVAVLELTAPCSGTLSHDSAARLESPKMFFRYPYYYLLSAESMFTAQGAVC